MNHDHLQVLIWGKLARLPPSLDYILLDLAHSCSCLDFLVKMIFCFCCAKFVPGTFFFFLHCIPWSTGNFKKGGRKLNFLQSLWICQFNSSGLKGWADLKCDNQLNTHTHTHTCHTQISIFASKKFRDANICFLPLAVFKPREKRVW